MNKLASPPAIPTVGNEMFVHNMRALWRHDPELALKVDAVMDDERLPLEPARCGAWTLRQRTEEGESIYLHSKYEPEREASRLVDSLATDEKYCFVVAGMGLGYHIRALAEQLSTEAFMICIEPSLELIATALTCVDLSESIATGRLIVLTDGDKTRLHQRLQDYSTLMMLGTQFFRHPPSVRVAGKQHKRIMDAISEFVTYTRMSLLTLVSNSRITCKNIAMNLANYVSTPPIDFLHNHFAGDPAIIVSAGPSLSKNVSQLAALKGKAVICAVQTALQPLTRHGVLPDFTTSLDFHEMSRRFFDGVEGLENVYLVAEPKATWHVLDHYPGPYSLLDNNWARLVLGESLGARAGLKAGATVAHLAFYLAVFLGCDPIIFVGQDLAFTGHVFYLPGVEIHQAWRGELNRFQSIEQKEWERIVRNRPILRRVPGVDGVELYTDELLLTYLEQFETDVVQTAATVINATEGGARMRGAQSMSLAQATQRYCNRNIDPDRFAQLRKPKKRGPDRSRLQDAADELQSRIAELDDAVTVCEELLTLLDELKGLTHDHVRFNKRLVRVDELRARVSQEGRAYQIVNSATQLAELRRFSADRRIVAEGIDDVERAKRQITRDVAFVSAVRDGTLDVKPILAQALQRVEHAKDQS